MRLLIPCAIYGRIRSCFQRHRNARFWQVIGDGGIHEKT